MSEIKEYTNSVQYNVIATVIDNLNENNGLTFIEENTIGTDKANITKDTGFKISTLNGMSEILNEIHALGYKIVKGK
jgi:hypothetical protein